MTDEKAFDGGVTVGIGKLGDTDVVVLRSQNTAISMNPYLARYVADAINRAAALLDGVAPAKVDADPYAATRRDITRAAAATGEQK